MGGYRRDTVEVSDLDLGPMLAREAGVETYLVLLGFTGTHWVIRGLTKMPREKDAWISSGTVRQYRKHRKIEHKCSSTSSSYVIPYLKSIQPVQSPPKTHLSSLCPLKRSNATKSIHNPKPSQLIPAQPFKVHLLGILSVQPSSRFATSLA